MTQDTCVTTISAKCTECLHSKNIVFSRYFNKICIHKKSGAPVIMEKCLCEEEKNISSNMVV
jgi:hypothetical protein